MIIHNEEKESSIDKLSIFFMNYVAKCDLTPYFNINISNNIVEDYTLFDNTYKPSINKNYAGLTILPHKHKGKIQILISEKYCTPDIVLHELTHMYDFVLFSYYFCKGNLYKVRKHKYYQTLIYWSEFHVKQVDIPYLHLLLDICGNIPKEKWLLDFKKQIKTFFYPEYNKKFANKSNPQIRDIMWYFGEIVVCNLYDENNTYNIPQEILADYDLKFLNLYTTVINCITFDDFVTNVNELYSLFD